MHAVHLHQSLILITQDPRCIKSMLPVQVKLLLLLSMLLLLHAIAMHPASRGSNFTCVHRVHNGYSCAELGTLGISQHQDCPPLAVKHTHNHSLWMHALICSLRLPGLLLVWLAVPLLPFWLPKLAVGAFYHDHGGRIISLQHCIRSISDGRDAWLQVGVSR